MAFVAVFLKILDLVLLYFIDLEGLYLYRNTAFILEVTGYKMSLMSQISLIPEMNKTHGIFYKGKLMTLIMTFNIKSCRVSQFLGK